MARAKAKKKTSSRKSARKAPVRKGGKQRPIEVYFWPTPNGYKITCMLEECRLPYVVVPVNIARGDQFKPEFLKIAPNNRMPAIVDPDGPGRRKISVFESGAILMYLAEKTGRFMATGVRQRKETLEWLFWQMAGLGPMTGQYGHFHVYAPEQIDYAKKRYAGEANRLLGVLDHRLSGRAFIAGDEYTIADMATYPWIGVYDKAPIDLSPYPEVMRWRSAIAGRPATRRAYALASEVNPDVGKPMSEEQKRVLFGQR